MSRRYVPVLLVLLHVPLAAAQDPFVQVPVSLPQWVVYESLAPADYDADGDLDLLVIRTDSVYGGGNAVYPELYRNDGVGIDGGFVFTRAPFPAPPYLSASPPGATVSWSDYDNDGDVDALVATRSGTALYRNDGGGTFTDAGVELPPYVEHTTYYFAEPRSSAWADYDNDGDLDLALPEHINAYPDTSRLVLYNNDGGTLARTDTEFPELDGDLDLTWGDVESDGDLDLLYLSAGEPCDDANPEGAECLLLYDNDAGSLAPRPLDFPEIEAGAADLGDFDLDGDLDILLVAELSNDPFYHYDRAIVYRNDGDAFAADTLEFPFSFDEVFDNLTAGQWADYDSDGDVDILIGGNVYDGDGPNPDYGGVVFVFANDGGEFTLTAALPASYLYGTLTWADFDADGDLDLLATGDRLEDLGGNQWGYVYFARLYRNDAPAPNRPPSPPHALSAEVEDGEVTFMWGGASDDHTPSDALTYNLWVQTRAGSDIVSPLARPGTGQRLLPKPGNVSLNRSWTLYGLPEGEYAWRVQAVDNAFNGGTFASGGTFTVGPATLAVAADPIGGPIVIPPEGSTFHFRVTVTNVSSEPQTFQGWTEAALPDGQAYGPLYGPARITLAPGQMFGPVTLEQAVPGSAPAGRYVYVANAGFGANAVVASDGFAFRKAAGGNGMDDEGAVVGTWSVTEVGEPLLASGGAGLPSSFALGGAYPNPVRGGEAVVRVDLPARAELSVRLYDVLGRAVLASAPVAAEAGVGRTLALDVSALPAGVYVYRVEASLPGGVARGSGRLTVVR
jgi:hypothetical protein